MSVIITSFKVSDEVIKQYPDAHYFSVSRWQPKGFQYDVLEFLGAYDRKGRRLSLRHYGGSLDSYKEEWKKWLHRNITYLNAWIKGLDNDKDIVLCCWCPYSKSTKRQITKYGDFACHTGLIARFINKTRPDISVLLDKDHANRLVQDWMPFKYRELDI